MNMIQKIHDTVIENGNITRLSDSELINLISAITTDMTMDMHLSVSKKAELINRVFSSFRGLGILDSIMEDRSITEIMINGMEDIYIEKEGRVEKTDYRFGSEKELNDLIQKIVRDAGREVNQANPIVDTRLYDGSRVNIVLPPISLTGPVVTIRRFPEHPMTVEQLISLGTITPHAAYFLENMVRAKYNIFVSGGTGSGKTTFLNALSDFIPKDERIITIEDSAELQLKGIDNLISMETRNANASGVGSVEIRDLIRTSLRMRPDRIIVGEVRGPEALDMLQAMNTGHDGSLSTGHANSTKDMLNRLETMVLMGADLPLAAIRQQIASAVDIIVHLSRQVDHTRKVMEIVEVTGYENGEIQTHTLFEFKKNNEKSSHNHIEGNLEKVGRLISKTDKLDMNIQR
ncbi:MAG: CpaF family protein [Lachnospiraceae bacterium]|nr:CpaF family protein [Lachnospiraceae bacterium]